MGFHVDPRQSDTQSTKVERSRKMVGTGVTIDDMREEQGQERLNWAGVTDLPAIPSGLVLIKQDGTALLTTGNAPPPQPEGGSDGGATTDPPGGDEGSGDDPAADGEADENKDLDPTDLVPVAPSLLADVPVLDSLPGLLASSLAQAKGVALPTLPDGFEQRAAVTEVAADPDVALAIVALQHDSLRRSVPGLQAALVELFVNQRGRALDRLRQYGPKAAMPKAALTPDSLLRRDEEDAELRRLYAQVAIAEVTEVITTTLDVLDIDEQIEDAVVDAIVERGVTSVGRVNDTTFERVEGVVAEGIRRGYSVSQIANGFPGEGYVGVVGVFDEAIALRSALAAQHESVLLFNSATLAVYGTDDVSRVEVLDGEGCGWKNHDDPDLADGSTRSTADALEHLLAHPHCARLFLPLAGDA
jgi:hypothetical protein